MLVFRLQNDVVGKVVHANPTRRHRDHALFAEVAHQARRRAVLVVAQPELPVQVTPPRVHLAVLGARQHVRVPHHHLRNLDLFDFFPIGAGADDVYVVGVPLNLRGCRGGGGGGAGGRPPPAAARRGGGGRPPPPPPPRRPAS
jgi:hypothetical protein